MREIDFIQPLHGSTPRDYLGRVNEFDKAEAAEVAIRFDADYWDGERRYGYGGYHYDGRWRQVAEAMVDTYRLGPGSRILDVGCGKAFLLYELQQLLPDAEVAGIDISSYAIEHSREEVRPYLRQGTAADLPWEDGSFDFVYSINTLHNLYIYDLDAALRELQRVRRGAGYICVEAYRNEREKANLLYWQLTCRAFHTPEEWLWLYNTTGYDGDFSFIYFE